MLEQTQAFISQGEELISFTFTPGIISKQDVTLLKNAPKNGEETLSELGGDTTQLLPASL